MTRERLLRSAKNNQVRAFKGDNTCGAARDLSRLEGEEASEEPPPPGPEHFGLRFGMKTKLLLPRYLWRRRTCLVERPQRIHPPRAPEHFGERFGIKTKLLLSRYLWRRGTYLVEKEKRPQRRRPWSRPLQERLNTLVSASALRRPRTEKLSWPYCAIRPSRAE